MNAYGSMDDRVPWSDADISALRQLIGLELPMSYIAQRLRRTTSAVSRKAQTVAIADMMRCPAFPPMQRR